MKYLIAKRQYAPHLERMLASEKDMFIAASHGMDGFLLEINWYGENNSMWNVRDAIVMQIAHELPNN